MSRAQVEGDFDIVYASWGWYIWLPDLAAWARTVASLLRPGGFVYVADQHPMIVWQNSQQMVQGDDGLWRLPGDPLPLSFSLKATKGTRT